MRHYTMLWATGEDKPGIVAGLTKVLFNMKCNLEDSSMMRLGSEFGILLILSSSKRLTSSKKSNPFSAVEKKFKLTIGFKPISSKLARFRPLKSKPYLISVLGSDRPGIVYNVTDCLKKYSFNITDLTTHRTEKRHKAGYVLFIEGEYPNKKKASQLNSALQRIGKKLKTRITLKPISTRIA